MCNAYCIIFGVNNLKPEEIRGKRVLEVGSLDLNGSLRPILESWQPLEYIGVDLIHGRGVDKICAVEKLVEIFGADSFDLVTCNELLEHVMDWRAAVNNIKSVCRPGGVVLITTRSFGFPYHAYPHDYWRYENADMREIFSDFDIIALENDPSDPGVFLKARKPSAWQPKDLAEIKLYSIARQQRVFALNNRDLNNLLFRVIKIKESAKNILKKWL